MSLVRWLPSPARRAGILAALALLLAVQARGPEPAEVAGLRSDDPPTRWNAALNLGARRERSALPALVAALGDPHPNVSSLACWALGRLGDRRAVPALVRHLGRAFQEDPLALPPFAISSLARLQDPRALPALAAVLAASPDTGDREEAVDAVTLLEGVDATPLLVALADDPDENVRSLALWGLASRPSPEALPRLLQSTRAEDPEARAASAFGLRFSGVGAVVLLEGLARDPHPEVRRRAAESLVLARSGTMLPDPPPTESPGELPDPGETLALSAPDLRAASLGDYEPESDAPIAMALAEREETSRLVERLRGGGPREARGNAITVLGNRRGLPGEALAALREALDDPEPGIRWKAAKALGKLDCRAAVPDLLVAARDPDKDVREDAVEALARISGAAGRSDVMAGLARAMEDPWPSVRLEVVLGLARIPGPGASRLLWRGLDDPVGLVRLQAARGLALRGDREPLRRLADDPDVRVRRLALSSGRESGAR